MKIFLIFLPIFVAIKVNANEESIAKCAELQEGRVRPIIDELTALSEWNYLNYSAQNFLLSRPCQIRQFMASNGLFNIVQNKWNMQVIVDKFGEDAYNYCRYELERNSLVGCYFALDGAMCLLKANRNVCETRVNLIDCVYKLGANNEQLIEYSEFPEKEKIQCLFKCFADKMKLYNSNYSWNLDNWVRAFGPMKYTNQDFSECKTDSERIKHENECDWMYEEHMCLERMNYNTHGTECTCVNQSTQRSIEPKNSIKTAFFTRL